METSKERKADEFDFQGQIKKVRVVAWLDEQEAGGKAVSREKESLGLAYEEKLPGPFKVILLQKNLWKMRMCVLCDLYSFEAARKGERLENFLHPERETDDGVQCNFCRKFQCRICLEQLHELGLGQQHPNFGHLKAYLLEPQPLDPVTVESSSYCSLKNKIVKCIPMVKSTCLKKEYNQQWDGMLWFPEFGLVETLLPHIFNAVNKKAGPRFTFAKTAIEDEVTIIKAAFKESKERKIAFKDIIVEKHTMTLLLAAVRLQHDKAHKSVKRVDQDYSFLKYMIVFEVPSETGRLLKIKSLFARMRGGAGRWRAATAIANHKSK
jgi:hypothetical protein